MSAPEPRQAWPQSCEPPAFKFARCWRQGQVAAIAGNRELPFAAQHIAQECSGAGLNFTVWSDVDHRRKSARQGIGLVDEGRLIGLNERPGGSSGEWEDFYLPSHVSDVGNRNSARIVGKRVEYLLAVIVDRSVSIGDMDELLERRIPVVAAEKHRPLEISTKAVIDAPAVGLDRAACPFSF